MRNVTKKERAVSNFVTENPFVEFKLTNHVFDRLRKRMGWTTTQARAQFPNRSAHMSLSDGIVEPGKGGAWKIHMHGWGKFVIVPDSDTDEWVAVTFYPARL